MEGAGVTPRGDGGDGKEGGTPLSCHLSEGFGGSRGDELGEPGGCFGENALGWVFLKSTSPPPQTVWVGWEGGCCISVLEKISRLQRHGWSF